MRVTKLRYNLSVVPAKAGTQKCQLKTLDSGFRRNDEGEDAFVTQFC